MTQPWRSYLSGLCSAIVHLYYSRCSKPKESQKASRYIQRSEKTTAMWRQLTFIKVKDKAGQCRTTVVTHWKLQQLRQNNKETPVFSLIWNEISLVTVNSRATPHSEWRRRVVKSKRWRLSLTQQLFTGVYRSDFLTLSPTTCGAMKWHFGTSFTDSEGASAMLTHLQTRCWQLLSWEDSERVPEGHPPSIKAQENWTYLLAKASQSVPANQRAGLGFCTSYISSWWRGETRQFWISLRRQWCCSESPRRPSTTIITTTLTDRQ